MSDFTNTGWPDDEGHGRIFGYVRACPGSQQELSCAIQRDALADVDVPDAQIYVDVAADDEVERPAWSRLVDTVDRGDTIVVYSPERIYSPNWMQTLDDLRERGVMVCDIRHIYDNVDLHRSLVLSAYLSAFGAQLALRRRVSGEGFVFGDEF